MARKQTRCQLEKRPQLAASRQGSRKLRDLPESVEQPIDISLSRGPAETDSHRPLPVECAQATVHARRTVKSRSRINPEVLTEQRCQLIGCVNVGSEADDAGVLIAIRV